MVEAVDAEIAAHADVIDHHKADIARLNNELEEAKGEAQRLNHENEQVRAILKSLLLAIEGEGAAGLGEAMVQLETKVSALVDEEGMEAAPADGPVEASADFDEEGAADLETVAVDDGAETVELGEDEPAVQEELLEDEAVPAEAVEHEADPEPELVTEPEPEVALEQATEIVDDVVAEPTEIAEGADLAESTMEVEPELASEQPDEDLAVAEMPEVEPIGEAVAAPADEAASDEKVDVSDTVGRYLQEDGGDESPDAEAPVSAIGDIVERLKSEKQLSEPADEESLAS
ncbi:MAG: hypothetical protein MI806_24300 [Minwuiales bacterium]|nr:hypothetical protein [Minwuiales bacterium]